MVDLLTVIPVWVTYSHQLPVYEEIRSGSDVGLYIAFGLTTTRILRMLRIRRKLQLIDDAVDRCLGQMILTIIVMILFSEFYKKLN